MVKFAEKLIILKEHGEALLQRLYNVKQQIIDPTHKPFVFRDEVRTQAAKVYKSLSSKDFPGFSDNIESVGGYAEIKNNTSKILEELQPFYQVFCELLEWTESAQKTLDEVCTNINVEFRSDLNLPILCDFMNIIVCFAKLILMLNRIDERKLILSFFNLTYTKVNGRSDSLVQRVAQLFISFEKPYTKLQEQFFTVQNHTAKIFSDIWNCYERGELAFLSNRRPLEMLSEPDKIPYPSVEPYYFEICLHEKLTEWFYFGYICCPEALNYETERSTTGGSIAAAASSSGSSSKNKKGLDFLLKILSEHYIISIYGNEVLSAHDPYLELFTKSKSIKKQIKKAEEMAAEFAHENHKQKRIYLRLQLRSLLNMLTDNPGLLGPKFQLVLCCLSLAKEEILWYFRHINAIPKYSPKKYKDPKEMHIGELIYLVDSITCVCSKHKDTISSYYSEIIHNLYSKKAKEHLSKSQKTLEGVPKQVADAVLNEMQSAQQFIAFRVNWKRLQIFLSGFQFKNYLKDAEIVQFFVATNKAYHFSRHVDDIDREIVELGSLKELYFFQGEVEKVFQSGLLGFRTQPLYSSAFVHILQYYPDNISQVLNPELREQLGKKSISLAKNMLTSIADQVKNGIINLRGSKGFAKIQNDIGGDKTLLRLTQVQNIAKQNANTEVVKIGTESQYKNRQMLEELRLTEKNLTQLLFSLSSNEQIQVYDTILYPTEFLREKIEPYLVSYVEKVASSAALPQTKTKTKDSKAQEFPPPTSVVAELKTMMTVLKIIEQGTNIGMEELMVNAIMNHFVHHDFLDSPFKANVTGLHPNLLRQYAKWYADLIDNIQKYNILYHPIRHIFCSQPGTTISSYRVEEYTHTLELRALVELIGPYGIRAFDDEILTCIDSIGSTIREKLALLHPALKELEQNLYLDHNIVDSAAKKFKGLETILSLGIRFGALITFRKQLFACLEENAKQKIPLIYRTVENAISQYSPNLFRDEQFSHVDGLAADCGMINLQMDDALRMRLTHTGETSTVWDVLPIALAVLLAFNQLNSSPYEVHLEGWQNNQHLAITGFVHLLTVIQSVKTKDKKVLEKEFEKFAEFSAQLLLYMRLSSKFNEKQVSNAHIFADSFIKASPFVHQSRFEEMLPYSFMRSVYIQTYEPFQKQEKQEA